MRARGADPVHRAAEAQVDVGEVNGRIFLNNSSVGFYPQIVREREKAAAARGDRKWVAFAHAAAHVLRRGGTLHVSVEDDRGGAGIAIDTPFLFVGNNPLRSRGSRDRHAGALDCGTLWLCAAPHASRAKLLGLASGRCSAGFMRQTCSRREVKKAQIHTRRRTCSWRPMAR